MDFAQVIIQRSKDVVKISPSSLSTKPSAKLYVLDSIGDQRYTSIWRWWGNRIQVSLFQAVASSLDLLLDALTAWFTGLDGYWNINWSILDVLTGHNEGRKKGERDTRFPFDVLFLTLHVSNKIFIDARFFLSARPFKKNIFFDGYEEPIKANRHCVLFFLQQPVLAPSINVSPRPLADSCRLRTTLRFNDVFR